MKLNLSINPTISGIPVANATGFLNIYKNGNAIISGGKLYSSADEARRRSRGKANWQLLGQINVQDYVADLITVIQSDAHKAAIAACDARLKSLLGITDPAPVCLDSGNHPIDTTPVPTDVVVKKPKALAKKPKAKSKAKNKPKVKSKPVAKPSKKPVAKKKPAVKAKAPAKKKIAAKKK